MKWNTGKVGLEIVFLLVVVCISGCKAKKSEITPYPSVDNRIRSVGHTTYYIDPVTGNDLNNGTGKDSPWKTFVPVNQLILMPGDRIDILSPGNLTASLNVMGEGTAESPVVICFAPGQYDFFPEQALRKRYHISNTNDTPDSLKSIAFCFTDSRFVQIKADQVTVNFRGKSVETCIDHCSNIEIEGIRYEYKRPTVSEMKITLVKDHYAEAEVHPDSWFDVKDSTLIWIGEGWQYKAPDYWQIFDPEYQRVWRNYLPIDQLKFSKIDSAHIGIHFRSNPAFKEGLIFQTRDVLRDYAAFFSQRSKNIIWKNVQVSFMHGMGFVSQFCENITFDSLRVAPSGQSGRTCAAWADILHFSGCKGQLNIENSFLSAANDDAINVHGTHLRIVQVLSGKEIKVRFMHNQTYGFGAFVPGDSIAFVDEQTLIPYTETRVEEVKTVSDREFVLSLSDPVPEKYTENDVVENTTWSPDVYIRGNTITNIPTRGILVSTRGKVVIEKNNFIRTGMSGILIADDAQSWFESGLVKDVTIRNNLFENCGGPVISIHPENTVVNPALPVHKNISIRNNKFVVNDQKVLVAKSTSDLKFSGNEVETVQPGNIKDYLDFTACTDVNLTLNRIVKP